MDAEPLAAMIREDHAEWHALVDLLDAHPDASLHGEASPVWNSRDVYAHLARWIERSTEQLQAYLVGRKLPKLEGTDDEINARWQQEDSGLSREQARERAQAAFQARLLAIEAVPLERWDGTLEKIARADGSEHYRGHREYIAV